MFWMTVAAMAGSYSVIEGERPVKDLHAAVTARSDSFAQCFKGAESVKMQIVVGRDGLVSDAKFSMTDVDQAVATCVTRGALKMRFSPSTDAAPTTYGWLATAASLSERLRGARPDRGDMLIKGGLTKDQVRETMTRNHTHLSFCFRKETAKDHDLQKASVDLHFGVDPAGMVVSAEGKDSDVGDELAQCVAKRIMSLSFPKSGQEDLTQVVYSLEFEK